MDCYLDLLDAEWAQLAQTPQARRRLRRWAAGEPALSGPKDLAELLVRRASDRDRAPAILRALARLAPFDDLAARTLLQAVMPGLARLVASTGNDDPMAREELVAIAWERIRTYPVRRHGSVAANVLRDTKKRYRAHRHIEAPSEPPAWPAGATPVYEAASAEDEAMSLVMLHELQRAERRGVVSRSALGLVLRTRVADTGLDVIAAEEGVSRQTLKVRRRRAEERLRRLPLAG